VNVSTAVAGLQERSVRLDGYVAQDPTNEQLLADAFDAAVAAHRLDSAARHVESGMAVCGSDAWLFRQATLQIAQGHLEEAHAVLADLAARSNHPAARFNLGYVKFRRGEYEASAGILEPLLEEIPAAAALWLRSLHQLGEVDRAWDWVDGAMSAGKPLDADGCGVASLLALDADHITRVEALADRALELLPNQAEALVAKGSVALGRDDALTAERLARRVIAQREDGRAVSLLAFARLSQQDLEGAQKHFERAVVLTPGHIGTWQGLGWTRLLQNDAAGAEAAFAQALALDRNFAESHGAYAVALTLLGRTEEARAHIELATRLDRNAAAAKYAALLLEGKGSDPAAIQQLARRLLAGRQANATRQLPEEGGASKA
jgi:tetratricopeptide (TPR) repeat protein